MSDTPLDELQYEIGDTLFGRGTPFTVAAVEFGPADLRVQDVARARADGRRFGRDYKAGRTITFDMNILTPPDPALDALDTLAQVWSGDTVRFTPGASTTLRWKRGGRSRQVTGRPREFQTVTGRTLAGYIPVTATFVTDTPYYFSDDLSSVQTTLAPPVGSGYTVPYTVPLQFSGENPTQGSFTVDGTVLTPLTFTIYGPITNPHIIIDGGAIEIRLLGQLASDDYVVVDPHSMTIITKFGENWAGKLDPNSTFLTDLAVLPGVHQVVLRGTSVDNTASLTTSWYDTFASY